jgi:signal transduction histidine kinase
MRFEAIPWIALGISLLATTSIWILILDLEKESEETEFIGIAQKITLEIEGSLNKHEEILMGFKGLFESSEEVTRKEFSEFYTIQEINARFPEILGVGYIQHIENETEKTELINEISEEVVEYSIFPEGSRTEYYPVVFLEPQNFRNKLALGYDVYSEEERKKAIDKSKVIEGIVITDKLTLVQETEENIQYGFLILLPIYHTQEELVESKEFRGFVYSVIRINDFVENVIETKIFEDIEIKIYDGVKNDENRVFSSQYVKANPSGNIFLYSDEIEFGENLWTVSYIGGIPDPGEIQDSRIIIPITGYTMSFLLFYTFVLLSKNIEMAKKTIKQERTSALGELAARFSHDVRNPLSNIRLALDLLKKKQKFESEESEEKIQIIEKNLDRISHQVEDVLDFVRIRPLEKTEESLKSLLNESLESLKIPKNIKISIKDNNITVFGDSNQLQIVFKNLITNSIQAIDKDEGEIKIKAKEESNQIIIEFIDSGPGFSRLKIKEVFEPLTTTKQTGTGLGLVTCKNIIENHNGVIEVTEKPTTFTIKMPKK